MLFLQALGKIFDELIIFINGIFLHLKMIIILFGLRIKSLLLLLQLFLK
jgi:hypothetical protein